jgi:hypothetical protein
LWILADRDGLATPGYERTHGVQSQRSNPVRIEFWKRDPDFVNSPLLTPFMIILKFTGAWTRQSMPCSFWHLRARSCGKIDAMSGRTRRTDVACAASGAIGRRRYIIHYAIPGARGIVAIHNLARLAPQLFDGQNQLFGDEKGQLGKTTIAGFSTFVRRVDCSSGE